MMGSARMTGPLHLMNRHGTLYWRRRLSQDIAQALYRRQVALSLSNVVKRTIRPITLNRKNALFAGSDDGGKHWAIIASLIETCKLNGIDPQACRADILSRIADDHPVSRID
jgi:hypothetical protein